jgi:CAAX protease family protein
MSTSTAEARHAFTSSAARSLIQRHPVVAYFLLAYIISWGGVALVSGGIGLSGGALMLALLIAISAGPTTASLLLTGVLDGRVGYRDLLARLTRWHVAPRWYAAALLMNPVALLVVLGALSQVVSPVYMPGILTSESSLAGSMGFASVSPALIAGLAVAVGLVAGFFEEVGWTGFATHRMLGWHSCLTAGLTLGVLWATWHIAGDLPGTSAAWGDQWPWRVLTWMYAGMVPYRVLMTWVYGHTRSVLVGILMHTAYTAGQALLQPAATGQMENVLWWGLLGLVLWVVVGLAVLADRAHVLRREAAATGGTDTLRKAAVT